MDVHTPYAWPDIGPRGRRPHEHPVQVGVWGSAASSASRLDVGLGAALALLVLTFFVTTLVRSPGAHWLWADLWLYAGTFLLAAVLCLRRAMRRREQRSAWLLLGASLVTYDIGNLAYNLTAHSSSSYNWTPDVFWLAFFPLAYAGILLLVRAVHGQLARTAWLDGMIVLGGVSAFAYALAFDHLFTLEGPNLLAVVINFAYPLGDLLLLAIVVWALGTTRGGHVSMWSALAAGMAVFAVVDTLYALQLNDRTYVLGGSMDALWPFAGMLVGVAALCPDNEAPTERPVSWWWLTGPPAFFALGSGVLLALTETGHAVPLLSRVLALVCVLSLVPRTALTYWEMGKLTESHKQAMTDDLTGLPNRRALMLGLGTRMNARGADGRVAVLMVDLDHFKEVNDSLGHAVGDDLLRLASKRMRACLREGDLLARIGGDEFAAVIDLESAASSPDQVAQRMLQSFEASFALEVISVHATISIGIAVCPDDSDDVSTLLRHADVAMYEAKRKRTGYQAYNVDRDTHTFDRLRTVEELRRALAEDGLTVYYQPTVDLATDTVRGIEALVRWQHPVRGVLTPETFLPLAEQHGLMHLVLQRVLDTALAQFRTWLDQGLDLRLAVNISTSDLMDVQLPAKIDAALRSHDVQADRLTLEVTEDTIMADPVRAKAVVAELSARGIRVSVDDYGTGYSSLSYLKELAVRELKLDRTFVAEFCRDPEASAIVRSTVHLAHALGLFMVAEGVESAQAARTLADLGCDVAQGYHYSPPRPGAEFTKWLLRRADTSRQPGHPSTPVIHAEVVC